MSPRTTAPEPPATPARELESRLAILADRAAGWQALDPHRRLATLQEIRRRLAGEAAAWVESACRARGVDSAAARAGEEWIAGPGIAARNLRRLADTWSQIVRHGSPRIDPAALHRRSGGPAVLRVLPAGLGDRLPWAGSHAEVWLEPGEPGAAPATLLSDEHPPPPPGVALVLGAGNVNSIPLLDALWMLYAELQTVLLKFNPVNAYLEPHFERIFEPLTAAGYLRFAQGGGATGAWLTEHRLVDRIHITGSSATHDRIVWGEGAEAARRRAAGTPRISRPISSELGNVSPVIVVPGAWTAAERAAAAENLVTQMTQNGGFNCNAAKILVTAAAWQQREALLDQVLATAAALPPRAAYYPGAGERWERFTAGHSHLRLAGSTAGGPEAPRLPLALVGGLDPADEDELLFREESFCTVSGEVALAEADPVDFLQAAVAFCNQRLFGTLNATLLVDEATRRRLGHYLEDAIDALRYGTVAVNHWAAVGFGLGDTPWGAWPEAPLPGRHPLADVTSGRGWVHNSRLLAAPRKAVIYGPLLAHPRPPWFVTHGNALAAGRRYAEYEAAPGPLRLARLAAAAVRG